MREIALFVEDYGHSVFLKALLNRVSEQFGIPVAVREFNSRGGHGQVEVEFKQFVRDLQRSSVALPDLVIVATDANCLGFRERRKRMQSQAEAIPDRVLYCIPDPHIERWLLLDSAAFKQVFGAPCRAPDQKCDRGRYKQLLADAVVSAGQTPLLGGLEHAEDLVNQMRLEQIAKRDDSFGDLLSGLHSFFRQWSSS